MFNSEAPPRLGHLLRHIQALQVVIWKLCHTEKTEGNFKGAGGGRVEGSYVVILKGLKSNLLNLLQLLLF